MATKGGNSKSDPGGGTGSGNNSLDNKEVKRQNSTHTSDKLDPNSANGSKNVRINAFILLRTPQCLIHHALTVQRSSSNKGRVSFRGSLAIRKKMPESFELTHWVDVP